MGRPRKTEENSGSDVRQRRSSEKRSNEDRPSEERDMPMPLDRGVLWTPPPPKGMTYRWVRLTVLNEPDHGNWGHKTQTGWRPVPRSRHPKEYPFIPMPGFNSDSENIINGGLILCEMPEEVLTNAKRRQEKLTAEQMNSIAWSTEGLAGAPTIDESSKAAQRHVRFKED